MLQKIKDEIHKVIVGHENLNCNAKVFDHCESKFYYPLIGAKIL